MIKSVLLSSKHLRYTITKVHTRRSSVYIPTRLNQNQPIRHIQGNKGIGKVDSIDTLQRARESIMAENTVHREGRMEGLKKEVTDLSMANDATAYQPRYIDVRHI